MQIDLWPEGVPDRINDGVPEKTTRNDNIMRVEHVHDPTLTVFLPDNHEHSRAAVVICPGGGYGIVAIEHEGYDVARWFNGLGIAAVVLKYRMSPYRHPVPLMDAQRALRIVRSRADQWHINSDCIGIMGFSAGGHLASTVATHFEHPTKTDGPLAHVSCRPDFMILGYPVVSFVDQHTTHVGSRANLLGNTDNPELFRSLSAELQVTDHTPPGFFFHAKDDPGVVPANSEILAAAMHAAGVPATVFLLETGGHGFGLRRNDWTEPCARWLRRVQQ